MTQKFNILAWGFASFILVGCAGIQSRFHEVKPGESVASIAGKYQVPVRELARYNSEKVAKKTLKPGVKLYIPFEESNGWDAEEVDVPSDNIQGASEARLENVPNVVIAATRFSWPLQGALTSKYGWRKRRMHDGIDIAAPRGTPVSAARSGHVLYAGNRIPGYGNLVILKHADSFSTVYAHLQKIEVRKGQFVPRGHRVGRVGKTGRATNYHLHFEVRNARVPVDPLLYLQGQYAANRITAR